MIEVRVRWFAAYREITGSESESLSTTSATAAELFDELSAVHSRLGSRRSSLVAVNDEMVDWSSPISEGDEVLFFPPVAGG